MGSLSGRSKAPPSINGQPVQQVVYVPSPTASPTISDADPVAPNEDETLAARAENILKRSRSRIGTVLTGFQGILSPNDLVAPRKTLLGE